MADVRLIDANALEALFLRFHMETDLLDADWYTPYLFVKDAPTIDAVPVVHGKWEICWEDWRHQLDGNKCSVCGFEYYGNLFKYCPNCGAKMDGGAEV